VSLAGHGACLILCFKATDIILALMLLAENAAPLFDPSRAVLITGPKYVIGSC